MRVKDMTLAKVKLELEGLGTKHEAIEMGFLEEHANFCVAIQLVVRARFAIPNDIAHQQTGTWMSTIEWYH